MSVWARYSDLKPAARLWLLSTFWTYSNSSRQYHANDGFDELLPTNSAAQPFQLSGICALTVTSKQ